MNRLDFVLPDFTRLAWTSDTARDVWEPRLSRVVAAWTEIEWRAVADGVRRCAIVTLLPEQFVEQGARWAELGLTAVPLTLMGASGQIYSATPVEMQPGQPFVMRMVIGRPADAAAFRAAFDATDDATIGDMLGYPACCREFFRATWVDEAMVDTTWPMAVGLDALEDDDLAEVEVDGPPLANILWRWTGVRAVPHLPCRFDCAPTAEFGARMVGVGRDAGLGEEMDWLEEILSWPVEWSALHGVAEVKTPVLRVSTRTDATASKYVVRRRGDRFPEEGARGLSWSFSTPVKLRLSGTPGFRRGLDHAVPSAPAASPEPEAPAAAAIPVWLAGDNGFASVTAMDAAHAPVVAAAVNALGDRVGPVVDLGCGNGALLAKVAEAVEGVEPYGIEADPERLAHAAELHPGRNGAFVCGDLFDAPEVWADGPRFALALLMPGRLLEVDAARTTALRAWLASSCDQVLVYAYGDWLDSHGGLAILTRKAGLAPAGGDGPAILASVLEAGAAMAGSGHGD